MITVINGKKDGFVGENKLYIGRYNKNYNLQQSPLHNPYVVGSDLFDRKTACKRYEQYLWAKVQQWLETEKHNTVTKALVDLANKEEDVVLVCWCKPLDCHGDVVVKAVNWLIKHHKEKL